MKAYRLLITILAFSSLIVSNLVAQAGDQSLVAFTSSGSVVSNGNAMASLSQWDIVSGEWSLTTVAEVHPYNLYTEATGRHVIVTKEDLGSDYEIHTRVMATGSAIGVIEPQIIFRYVDESNFYFAGIGVWGYRAGIGRMVNGVAVRIADSGSSGYADLSYGQWYEVDIKVVGTVFTVYVNGEAACSVSDPTFSDGRPGFTSFNTNALYDYVKVVDVSPTHGVLFSDYFGGSSQEAIDDHFPINDEPSDEPFQETVYGINYHSIWWHYNAAEGTTNTVLHRDFALFKTQGVDRITLLIQWSYMEPTRGSYRASYVEDIRRVIGIAAQYDIQCIVDVHTAGSFSMPSWTSRKMTDIVTDPSTRQAFLEMERYVIGALDGPNVHSFHIFNEPYLAQSNDPGSAWLSVSRDEALDFLQELYDNAKTVTGKPLSVRYGSDSVVQNSQFGNDPRVWSSCDYITVNYYVAYHRESYLRQIVQEAKSRDMKTMIGEFGYRDAVNNDDEVQRAKVEEHIILFDDVGLDYAMAWIWRADNVVEDGSYAPVGGGYNLAANLQGDPRPAFYEIGKANSP